MKRFASLRLFSVVELRGLEPFAKIVEMAI
jgi:hypothetical protein